MKITVYCNCTDVCSNALLQSNTALLVSFVAFVSVQENEVVGINKKLIFPCIFIASDFLGTCFQSVLKQA
jgi:hypothetical protein